VLVLARCLKRTMISW